MDKKLQIQLGDISIAYSQGGQVAINVVRLIEKIDYSGLENSQVICCRQILADNLMRCLDEVAHSISEIIENESKPI